MPSFDYPGGRTRTFGEDLATVLEDLSSEEWGKVKSHAQTIHFKSGDALIERGDEDDALYILMEGEVEVLQDRSLGGTRSITRIPAGSIFGEISFFDRQPRSAFVQARTDGNMLRITRQQFDELAAQEPDIARQLLLDLGKVLADRLRTTTANSA